MGAKALKDATLLRHPRASCGPARPGGTSSSPPDVPGSRPRHRDSDVVLNMEITKKHSPATHDGLDRGLGVLNQGACAWEICRSPGLVSLFCVGLFFSLRL
jgi:hypothetical protein